MSASGLRRIPQRAMSKVIEPALPFEQFTAVCAPLKFSQADLTIARGIWRVLDWTQQQAAIAGITARIKCGEYDDPAYVPLPQTYLRSHLWERPLRVKRGPTMREAYQVPRKADPVDPEMVNFEAWAKEHGYPLRNGAELVKAEEAY